MNIRLLTALALIVVGLVLATVSALAELIGLGDPTNTFGWKQIVGLAVGLALLVVGIVIARKGTRAPKRSTPRGRNERGGSGDNGSPC